MGKIRCLKEKVIIRMGVDEILNIRWAATKDVFVTLAEQIRKVAQMKAQEKKIELPCAATSVSFDREACEFVITFCATVEAALEAGGSVGKHA